MDMLRASARAAENAKHHHSQFKSAHPPNEAGTEKGRKLTQEEHESTFQVQLAMDSTSSSSPPDAIQQQQPQQSQPATNTTTANTNGNGSGNPIAITIPPPGLLDSAPQALGSAQDGWIHSPPLPAPTIFQNTFQGKIGPGVSGNGSRGRRGS